MAIYLEPVLTMPNVVSATWRQLGVHAFEGEVTLDDMVRIGAAGALWHRKNPGPVVEMVIIFPSDARLSGDERARMAALVKKWESTRAASATVVLASGVAGSMHRSVLTGIQMIAPPPHPTKVFGNTSDAALWLAPYAKTVCGVEVTSVDLLEAVAELCDAFQDRRARVVPPSATGSTRATPYDGSR